MFRTFKKPAISKIYSLALVAQLADTFSTGIAVLFAIELGADNLQINLISAIGMAMTVISQLPFGILSDRLGRKSMLILIRIMIAFAPFFASFLRNLFILS